MEETVFEMGYLGTHDVRTCYRGWVGSDLLEDKYPSAFEPCQAAAGSGVPSPISSFKLVEESPPGVVVGADVMDVEDEYSRNANGFVDFGQWMQINGRFIEHDRQKGEECKNGGNKDDADDLALLTWNGVSGQVS